MSYLRNWDGFKRGTRCEMLHSIRMLKALLQIRTFVADCLMYLMLASRTIYNVLSSSSLGKSSSLSVLPLGFRTSSCNLMMTCFFSLLTIKHWKYSQIFHILPETSWNNIVKLVLAKRSRRDKADASWSGMI